MPFISLPHNLKTEVLS